MEDDRSSNQNVSPNSQKKVYYKTTMQFPSITQCCFIYFNLYGAFCHTHTARTVVPDPL